MHTIICNKPNSVFTQNYVLLQYRYAMSRAVERIEPFLGSENCVSIGLNSLLPDVRMYVCSKCTCTYVRFVHA